MNLEEHVRNTRSLANMAASTLIDQDRFEFYPNRLTTLRSINWGKDARVNEENFQDLREWNLDPNCHLGQLAISLEIAQRQFPQVVPIYFGEVRKGYVREQMLVEWKTTLRDKMLGPHALPPNDWTRRFVASEFPHGVLVIEGKQYDPMLQKQEHSLNAEHPLVFVFEPWMALSAARLVALSRTEPDSTERLKLLGHALKLCPDMLLPREERACILHGLGRMEEALEDVEFVLDHRILAGGMLFYEGITKEEHPDRRAHYDDVLWELVVDELNQHHKLVTISQ